MHTKINNWFITPDYKPEYGVYLEFNSFESYKELIRQNESGHYCCGYTFDEMVYYLSNSGYLPGDIKGRFTSYDKIVSVFLKRPFKYFESDKRINPNFMDISEEILYDTDLYTITPFHSGAGYGCGVGDITGCGDEKMRRKL